MRAEWDALLLQKKDVSTPESTEELLSRVASVSQERDQLQEALEALREEKQQLRAELEDKLETVCDHTHSAVLQQPRFPRNGFKNVNFNLIKAEKSTKTLKNCAFQMQCDWQQQLTSEPQSLRDEQDAQRLLQVG